MPFPNATAACGYCKARPMMIRKTKISETKHKSRTNFHILLVVFSTSLVVMLSLLQGLVVVPNYELGRTGIRREGFPSKTKEGPSKSFGVSSTYDGLVVDIMSIGSKTRLNYQEAQRNTFATHKSVRFFFNITEADDSDPNCSDNFGPEDSYAVSKFCHAHRWKSEQFLMRYLKQPYARKRWLQNKASPHGWMCAQARPSHGLAKMIAHYRIMKETHGNAAVPDYLFVADDDTYVNMELFEQYMSTFDTNIPRAVAGCLVRSPINEVNFTIPFGGFGTIFSRGAIELYMRPVYCSVDKMDDFSKSACSRLEENQIGERDLFVDGMSVSDLQAAYATFQPFAKYKEWKTGFCLHSDWLWGFFANFYNIAKHNDEEIWKDVPHARMEGYNESEIYAGNNQPYHAGLRRICNNENEKCDVNSPICHYQTPDDMLRLTKETQHTFPNKYTYRIG